jgi:hypothetical protein
MSVSKRRILQIAGITFVLLICSFGISKIFIYQHESFIQAKNYLEKRDNVLSYFDGDLDIEYSISEYDIRHRKTITRASFILYLRNSSKFLKVHIILSKKINWTVVSIEYQELPEPAPFFHFFF